MHMRIGSILSETDVHTEFSTFSDFPEIYFQLLYNIKFSWILTCDVFTSHNVNNYDEEYIEWIRISAVSCLLHVDIRFLGVFFVQQLFILLHSVRAEWMIFFFSSFFFWNDKINLIFFPSKITINCDNRINNEYLKTIKSDHSRCLKHLPLNWLFFVDGI